MLYEVRASRREVREGRPEEGSPRPRGEMPSGNEAEGKAARWTGWEVRSPSSDWKERMELPQGSDREGKLITESLLGWTGGGLPQDWGR